MVEKTKSSGTNWKPVGGDFPPSIFLAENESVEGVLLETHDDAGKSKDRTVYLLDTGETGFKDTQGNAHKGKGTLWGSGLLDVLMKAIVPGTKIKVVFSGKRKVKIDGKIRGCNQHEVYTAE